MRYLFILFLATIFQPGYGQYYHNNNQQLFRASGDAILRIPPDQVVLSLGIESRGKELLNTKDDNYKVMSQAIKYCKDQGIKEKHIQTDYIRIDPRYDRGNDITIDYYSVSQSVSIILEDLDKYEEMLTELLNIGINKVNNIEFRTTELKENRYKVRKMAIEAAKEKAEFLSKEVDIQLGEIINIQEQTYNPVNSFSRSNYANISQNMASDYGTDADNNSLSIGMLSLKANVTLTFLVKDK